MSTRRFAALALLTLAASCGDLIAPNRSDLDSARRRWSAQNLHTYAFTLRRNCFCAIVDPLYVLVQSDTVAGVLNLRTGETVDRQFGMTVDDLFAFVQRAIANHAYMIHATYDPARGFPAQIEYDGAAQIADDEVSFYASDVHAVAPPP